MARNFVAASSQYLQVNAAVASVYPVTMACWFKASSLAVRAMVTIANSASASRYWRLGITSTGQVRASVVNGTSIAHATTAVAVTTGVWAHACAVFRTDSDRSAYLNGGNRATDTTTVELPIGLNATAIGARPSSVVADFFDGDIAEAAIWNVDIGDTAIALLARGVSPLRIRRPNLVAYWPLFGTGAPEPDYTGFGRHLTVTGATWAAHAPVMAAWGFDWPFPTLPGAPPPPPPPPGALASKRLLVGVGL